MLNRRELLAGAGAAAALLACQKSRTSRGVEQIVAAQASRDGAGVSLRASIARRGPFVMSTEAVLQQAIRDYQSGHLTDAG